MLQFIVFLIIQIPLLPLSIIGFVATFLREMIISKRLGVSSTAVRILKRRWIMHYFKSRDDEASIKLVKAIPIESHYALLVFLGPAIIANRIVGYVPSRGRIPEPGKETKFHVINTRTIYFDRIMEKNVDQVEQVVIMGAGFDLRVLKYTKGRNVKVFELDQQNTQDLKIKSLNKAGIVHDWITFVPIDFNQESWSEKLVEFGFDPTKKTFFLWEGVTPYLEEKVIKQTLKAVANSSGKGSVITFDFYSMAFIAGEGSFLRKYVMQLNKITGESYKFGIDTSRDPKENVETLLSEAGLTLGEFRLMGKTTEKVKPLGGLVEAIKK